MEDVKIKELKVMARNMFGVKRVTNKFLRMTWHRIKNDPKMKKQYQNVVHKFQPITPVQITSSKSSHSSSSTFDIRFEKEKLMAERLKQLNTIKTKKNLIAFANARKIEIPNKRRAIEHIRKFLQTYEKDINARLQKRQQRNTIHLLPSHKVRTIASGVDGQVSLYKKGEKSYIVKIPKSRGSIPEIKNEKRLHMLIWSRLNTDSK